MTPERWQSIKDLLPQALGLAPERRGPFLDSACGNDAALRQEVEALIACGDRLGDSFLESPPLVTTVALAKGSKLGPYEIVCMIGAGGMGEVYRAHDSRLGRDVAIKVLPTLLSNTPDRLRRFQQEARAAAALNHPNILAVHDLGTANGSPYVVSELLDGETLRARLNEDPLPVRKAVDLAVQIAHGLAAAHGRGIVHRDLKPENLFVTQDGWVKILDFGLAKLVQPQSEDSTAVDRRTDPGVVMGTVGYMSPEQVRAQDTDHRSDIFAFGAILYEMLSGRRAFSGDTTADVAVSILTADPPALSAWNRAIPVALDSIVSRCLEKNREERFHSARDVAFALEAMSRASSERGLKPVSVARPRSYILALSFCVVVGMIAGGAYYRSHHVTNLTDADTIVVGDFANSTGDPVFDDTLKQGLTVALRQSPFLNILPDNRVSETLKLMTFPISTSLTPQVARQVCQRAGSKAFVTGAIARLGSEYVLGLKAVNCQNGDGIAQEQVTVPEKEKVLDALGSATARLRTGLGESLATVQKFDVPLAQATTPSLEALQVYSQGRRVDARDGPAAALPYFLRAIQLDQNFAMAYLAAGNEYFGLAEERRPAEYFSQAFQLRDKATDREKLAIMGNYYLVVTGELDKATQTFEKWILDYPRDPIGFIRLGLAYAHQGSYDKAVQLERRAVQLAPENVSAYVDLGNYLPATGRVNEARQILTQARSRQLDSDGVRASFYMVDFLDGDFRAMAEQTSWLESNPDYENEGLFLDSETEAYFGHLTNSRELTQRAVDSAIHADSKESAATWWAIAALREAEFGNARQARAAAREALKLAPTSHEVEIELALAFAAMADTVTARSFSRDLRKRHPLDTQTETLWLPVVEARLAVVQKRPFEAIDRLKVATPIEMGSITFSPQLSCLYAPYVRGEAYLAAREGIAAANEFQKILDHNGIVQNCVTGAVAHLGLARANALEARTSQGAVADAARARALIAYRDFLTLWKDADPDTPILRQAKAEYAKLQ